MRPPSLRAGDRLVVASHNEGKIREIADLLRPYDIDATSAPELGSPEVEETGSTFVENAEIKALAAADATGLMALADDSGLEVAALDGAPGIHSARWAGSPRDFGAAMERINSELEAKSPDDRQDRRARFVCALCLATPDGRTRSFLGIVDGHLVWPARGTNGFGYDPIFVPDNHEQTFGEMDPENKHAISHRARAFAKFVAAALSPSGGEGEEDGDGGGE